MKIRERELHLISVLIDLFILNLSLLVVAFFSLQFYLEHYLELFLYLVVANASWLLAFSIVSKKMVYYRRSTYNRLIRLTMRFLFFFGIQFIISLPFLSGPDFQWEFIVQYSLLFYTAKVGLNVLYFSYLKYKQRKDSGFKRALLIGINETMKVVRDVMHQNPVLGYKFAGFLCDIHDDKDIVGNTDDLRKVIQRENINAVFVAVDLVDQDHDQENSVKDYLTICNEQGVRIFFIPQSTSIENGVLSNASLNSLSIINPHKIPLDDLESRLRKRIFDIIFSGLVVLLLLSWLVPIIGIIIKLTSRGPVFFVQKRTGVSKKTFNCIKFRTMVVNQDSDSRQATSDDVRITCIGKFLRKTNLDEFPQFFNVLRGDMSVVGPRPHMLKHTVEYSKLIDNYLLRHYIKPGITGWAQVNGFRGETDELWKMQKRVEHDMEYLQRWSFGWDLEIIIRTFVDLKAFMNAG